MLALLAAGCRRKESRATQQAEIGSPAGPAASRPGGARMFVDSSAGEIVVEVGPEELGPAGSESAMRVATPYAMALPIDGWLRTVQVDIVDSHGRLLPRNLLHHANIIAPEHRELFSPIMLRIGAAGPETAPIELPRVLGYRVHAGDSLLVTAMLDNPAPQERNDVWVRVRLAYVRAGTWLPPVSIHPFYVDVMPPAGVHAYDLPPGHSEKSWEGNPAIAGRVLAVGGHLHQYGVALRFRDVTAGRDLWVAHPERDAAGDVLAVPTATFLWRGGVTLRPDHVYRLTAVYENPTGHVIPDGAMGTLGGVFLPARGARWPQVARSDSAYRLDVQVTCDTNTMRMASDSNSHGMDMRSPAGSRHHHVDAATGSSPNRASQSHLSTAP